jgi:hypothetical protein
MKQYSRTAKINYSINRAILFSGDESIPQSIPHKTRNPLTKKDLQRLDELGDLIRQCDLPAHAKYYTTFL